MKINIYLLKLDKPLHTWLRGALFTKNMLVLENCRYRPQMVRL